MRRVQHEGHPPALQEERLRAAGEQEVGAGQEVLRLLAAAVEVVDVAHHGGAALLPRHHQHRLLEGHAGQVGAGRGRRDDEARPPGLGAARLTWNAVFSPPARREHGVPGEPPAAVVAAGPELRLEAGAALVARGAAHDPGGAPRRRQVVPRHEEAAAHVQERGRVGRRRRVELVGQEQQVAHRLPVPGQRRRARLQAEQLPRRHHGVAHAAQQVLRRQRVGLAASDPDLQRREQLRLALQHQVGAPQQRQQRRGAHAAGPRGAPQQRRHVPRHEAEAVVPQRRVPGERGVLVPGRHEARGRGAGQEALAHVARHAAPEARHAVRHGQPVERRGELQAQRDLPTV
ncbi:hypothetical protein EYF80_046653 [Liparis tanakae]|uniref:Uncharacterized protein n=1 Tax=Liparis tanakae TaxID=230148 RepID=A0A4Z2FPT3_9TELE|nr:hypothetical protein EYF80_046653 [Liparis tanakae]